VANGNGNGARRARFVEEYLVDLNATQAAIRAGYSEKTANRQGSRLLSNVDIQEAIAKGKVRLSEQTGITAQYVINGLREIASQDKGSARVRAFELLGKHLGLFTDVLRHEVQELPAMVVRRE